MVPCSGSLWGAQLPWTIINLGRNYNSLVRDGVLVFMDENSTMDTSYNRIFTIWFFGSQWT